MLNLFFNKKLLLLIILFPVLLFSQELVSPHNYILGFTSDIASSDITFKQSGNHDSTTFLEYEGQNLYRIGPFFQYKHFGFSLKPQFRKNENITIKNYSPFVRWYHDRFGFEFYIERTSSFEPIKKDLDTRTDLFSRSVNFNAYFAFNDSFSLYNSLIPNKKRVYKGSVLAAATFTEKNIESPKSIIPANNPDWDDVNNFKRVHSLLFGLYVGYAHMWAFVTNFYMSGKIFLGGNFQQNQTTHLNDNIFSHRYIEPSASIHFNVGYAGKRWLVDLAHYLDQHSIRATSKVRIVHSVRNMSLSVGYKFSI